MIFFGDSDGIWENENTLLKKGISLRFIHRHPLTQTSILLTHTQTILQIILHPLTTPDH